MFDNFVIQFLFFFTEILKIPSYNYGSFVSPFSDIFKKNFFYTLYFETVFLVAYKFRAISLKLTISQLENFLLFQ